MQNHQLVRYHTNAEYLLVRYHINREWSISGISPSPERFLSSELPFYLSILYIHGSIEDISIAPLIIFDSCLYTVLG